jgi:hypothetical protein
MDVTEKTEEAHARFVRPILDAVQNIVIQAGVLSRYFWPAHNKSSHRERALELRRLLKMDDNNPLQTRAIRNAMEHFDERLDLYLQEPVAGYFIPQYVGPYDEGDGVPRHFFRAYYTDQAVFEILGERYDIEPVVIEIERVHAALGT